MEVAILKSTDAEFLSQDIASYLKTGWRMEGQLVVAPLVPERVLYVQKMVRGD